LEDNIVQNSNLEILDNAIRDLALVIQGTGKEVADALETVRRISKDARSGNEALSIMGHSINKIFESSTQVNGIISAVISEINEIAQKNSQAIEQIAEASKSLVEMVDKFSSEIRNYHD